jgi:hypothetical protein
MNTIKGFISIGALANNAPGQTALFGELSNRARTYSRTTAEFVNPTSNPNVRLETFVTKNASNANYTPNNNVVNHILAVASWINDQHTNSAIPSNASKAAFINSLSAQFTDMTDIEINEILNGSPSTKRMPDYVEWHYDDAGVDTLIKVWFSDSRFRSQYDEYSIYIVPPIAPINQLNNTTATVNSLLANVRHSDIINAIRTIEGDFPSTDIIAYPLTWNDPGVGTGTIVTEWTAVVYGIAGTDLDNIKNAIRQYITDNSALTTWSLIYPALYADNEYVIIPMWNDIASPETGLDVELYRGCVSAGDLINIALSRIPNTYAQSVVITSFLGLHLTVSSAFFRSLTFLAIGNPNNVNADFNLKVKYPDYMTALTTSPDWLRMSIDTRNFITTLNDALEKAITVTATSPVPVGYTRVTRNGKVYLTFTLAGFQYMVLVKSSY